MNYDDDELPTGREIHWVSLPLAGITSNMVGSQGGLWGITWGHGQAKLGIAETNVSNRYPQISYL